jgi:hypothetical protein
MIEVVQTFDRTPIARLDSGWSLCSKLPPGMRCALERGGAADAVAATISIVPGLTS